MKCQEDRVLIGVLVAREKELLFGCTPFKRRLLSLLHNLHAPSGDHERITATRIQATVVATHVAAPKIVSRMDWTTWSANRVPSFPA